MAPFKPWALTNRPTRSLVLLEIAVHHINANFLAIGKRVDQGAKSLGCSAASPDYPTQIIWVNVNLKKISP
jgi:hypothetical protein